jgi:hypothetical protein
MLIVKNFFLEYVKTIFEKKKLELTVQVIRFYFK